MNAANQIFVFDRALVRRRRNRTAAIFAAHSVLFDEISQQLLERLADVKKEFSSVLVLAAPPDFALSSLPPCKEAFIVAMDLAGHRLTNTDNSRVVADEEMLPFAAESFDLIIAHTGLHWVNDLPGALIQLKRSLKPDGLFLASVLGGATLQELRVCLLEAEVEVAGGISPRLSPTLDLLTASGLLQRAGFALPVADHEKVTLTYPDAFALMRDLRGMGENNAHGHRLKQPTRRAIFEKAALLYHERYGMPDRRIPATFEVLFLHGWNAPASST